MIDEPTGPEVYPAPDGPLLRHEANLRVVTHDPRDDLLIPYTKHQMKMAPSMLTLIWEGAQGHGWELTKVEVYGLARLKDGGLGVTGKRIRFDTGWAGHRTLQGDTPQWIRDAIGNFAP